MSRRLEGEEELRDFREGKNQFLDRWIELGLYWIGKIFRKVLLGNISGRELAVLKHLKLLFSRDKWPLKRGFWNLMHLFLLVLVLNRLSLKLLYLLILEGLVIKASIFHISIFREELLIRLLECLLEEGISWRIWSRKRRILLVVEEGDRFTLIVRKILISSLI